MVLKRMPAIFLDTYLVDSYKYLLWLRPLRWTSPPLGAAAAKHAGGTSEEASLDQKRRPEFGHQYLERWGCQTNPWKPNLQIGTPPSK